MSTGPRLEGQDPEEIPPYMRPIKPLAQTTRVPTGVGDVQVGMELGVFWIRWRIGASWSLWRRMETPEGDAKPRHEGD